jgi:hypothetical protein
LINSRSANKGAEKTKKAAKAKPVKNFLDTGSSNGAEGEKKAEKAKNGSLGLQKAINRLKN